MGTMPVVAWLAALVVALRPWLCWAWDLRVSKGLYTRGYDALRVSAITSGPEEVPAPWQWSWEAPFKHHWRSKTLRSQIVKVGELGQTVSIGGKHVSLKLPVAGEGVTGIFLSDPCFTSRGGFRCPNGDRMNILERSTQLLNKLLGSNEFHFWGVLGDNFYDMHGEVTSEFFSRLSVTAKSKPFFTVVGNHDLWMGGAPPGLAIDELGYGFAQFYGQDTFAATSAGPYNLSGNPEKLEIAAADNFIFATQLGDLALFGYSGAHDWASTRPHAEDFCTFVGRTQTVNAVVLLGHWNLANLGCRRDMDVPTVYRRMREMPGCDVKRMIYFMGHEHCNQVTEQISGPLDAVGFMIGGAGMWGTGCSQFGITILRSIPGAPGGPNVAVEYVPLGEDASFGKDPLQVASGFDDFVKCLNASSYGGCREQHALSFRAISEDTIVLPRPLQKPSPPPPPQTTPVPTRTSSTPAPATPSMASSSPDRASGAAGMGVAAARTGAASAVTDAGTAGIASGSAGTRPRGRTGASGTAGMVASAGPHSTAGSDVGPGTPSVALAILGGALAGGGAVAVVASLLFCWLRTPKAREPKERGSLLADRCRAAAEEDEEEPSPASRGRPPRRGGAGGREGQVRWEDGPTAGPRPRSDQPSHQPGGRGAELEMAPQAGLGRFFGCPPPKPGGEAPTAPGLASSPRTPTARAGRGAAAAQAGPPAMTPHSEGSAVRKRGGRTPADSDPDAKRPRGAADTLAAPEPSQTQGPGICLPVCEERGPAAAGNSGADLDLKAALDYARRPDSKVPPFTAECLHHYNSGGGAQYSWPDWLRPENLRDAQGRRPSEPGFNQGTLWVPGEKVQKDSGHGTPMLIQFWKLKSAHFDKIALFKVGKFYELFYYDAFIAQRECGLKWMGEKKPHVGFPEMAKNTYAKMLVDSGYKVVVVEQVERVAEQKERVVSQSTGPTCVERDLCEVFTKGTLVDPELLGGAGARYMAFLHFEEQVGSGAGAELPFAACLVDAATSQIYVGRITDAPDRNALRTLLAQVQPSEVVYTVTNVPSEVLTILRRLPCRPQLSPLHAAVSSMAARDKLARYRRDHPGRMPEAVEAMLAPDSMVVAVAGAMEYLEAALLGRRLLPFAVWDALDKVCSPSAPSAAGPSAISKRMVLDATALSALEVLETLEGTFKGSLLDFLDNTSTPFGFRLLKQWLCAPLCDAGEIQRRQDSVEFLLQHTEIVQPLKEGLKKVPMDLERATSRIWSYALQAERHAVMYEDITAKRLGDFIGLLRAYEQCLQVLASVLPAGLALPERLARLVRTPAQGGAFPELQAIISHLRGSVVDVPNPKNGKSKFRPTDGADAQYDAISQQIEQIKAKLETELQVLRSRHPNATLNWIHRPPGERYEVEVDHNVLPKAFLQSVDTTSQSKAKLRFKTQVIKDLVAELDSLEDRREDCIFPFLSRLFQEFHAHQAHFRAAVRCLAELDALLSLAWASRGLAGAACRAELVAPASGDAPGTLELRGCRHPVAASRMGNSFVPNDTVMNAGNVPGVLVVTGPNMGGKSTVLRQTCIAAIMAQLGCRVNADVCRLTPIDRIFTRIGSHDAILEGKSTLLTELEETAAVLQHATPRSLAVLDELGRGTSTFDGAAIAAAVLNELAENVRCMVMFATHYHPVSRQAARSPSVAPFHMAAEVDPATNEMTFLYRFLPGLCPASHGHNVARLAGLPAKVLEEALARSAEFERLSSGLSPGEAHPAEQGTVRA